MVILTNQSSITTMATKIGKYSLLFLDNMIYYQNDNYGTFCPVKIRSPEYPKLAAKQSILLLSYERNA